MKKSTNQIVFESSTLCDNHSDTNMTQKEESKGHETPTDQDTQIEFLPCLFQANIDESNKNIYFDSIVGDAEVAHVPKGLSGQTSFKQVSLHGRRMIGLQRDLPEGYKGYVFQRQESHAFTQGKTLLQQVAKFDRTTEWRKDQWVATEDSYAKSLHTYLECSAILNAEE